MHRFIRFAAIFGIVICLFASFAVFSFAEYYPDQYIYNGYVSAASSDRYSNSVFYINSGDVPYNMLHISSASREIRARFEDADGVSLYYYVLVPGDILNFSGYVGDSFSRWIDARPEFSVYWEADNTSIFASLRSTVSHYLFDDDFSNVPFGDFWVSGLCVIAVVMVAVLPFMMVFWITRRFFCL